MKLLREIEEEIQESGVEYSIIKGGSHWKVFVGGKLCAIIPMNGRGNGSVRGTLNIKAQIKRRIREINDEKRSHA